MSIPKTLAAMEQVRRTLASGSLNITQTQNLERRLRELEQDEKDMREIVRKTHVMIGCLNAELSSGDHPPHEKKQLLSQLETCRLRIDRLEGGLDHDQVHQPGQGQPRRASQ